MRFFNSALLLCLGTILGWALRLPNWQPPVPAAESSPALLETLGEVTGREFDFRTVIARTTGHEILSPTAKDELVLNFVRETAKQVAKAMSRPDSPARKKQRINEVSALFEEALQRKISSHPDFLCTIPKTKDGKSQRSGYPDLRLEHLPTGTVVYLDPKLFEASALASSFRTFYYEPSPKRSKVTEDALHFLLGFSHDGKDRAWTFAGPRLIDLSKLKVTLKAEFSASNRDLYR